MMAPDVCEGLRRHRVLKKGPWTTSEDLLLLEYVKKHGEGNWNAVQMNSGLMRCGKSCRLRWANHLRPHLKKGAFSPEEEHLIVQLHAKLGNKWARMAAQLPGRTDNEIKNYWNTRLKRRQRAGLPIYPHEVVEHEHQQQQRQHKNSSQTPSPSSLIAPTHHHHHNNPKNNPFTFPPPIISPNSENHTNIPLYTNSHLKLYQDNNGGLSLFLDASNSFFSSSTFFNQLPMNSLIQYNSLNPVSYGIIKTTGGGMGLPSIQSPPPAVITPAASSSDFAVSSDGGAEEFEVERGSRSGLLEDLFGESRALTYYGRGGNLHEEEEAADFGFSHGGSSSHDSYEGVEAKAPMDDELMNLLDNFPLSVPIPDWNGEEDGSESPILTHGTSGAMHGQPISSEYNPRLQHRIKTGNLVLAFGITCQAFTELITPMHQSSRIENIFIERQKD